MQNPYRRSINLRRFYPGGAAVLMAQLMATLLMAQGSNPPPGPVYTDEEIPVIRLYVPPDSLADLYLEENWYSNHEYPATFVWQSGEVSDSLGPVGIRFRGNTSRDKLKKSFKISFNTFSDNGSFMGLEKLNLNAEVNDPSMLRSRLGWELFRYAAVPASRSNHIKLYINDLYYGLYQNIEHIDEVLVANRFGNSRGNLYKCTYPADLNYISDNQEDYKFAPTGTRAYELTINEDADDYSDLTAFISFLNQASDEELACELWRYFNVSTYLKTAAVEVLIGHWDGYIYNKNNFYLYHNTTSDRFEYLPYDLDNTWGIDFLDRNWAERDVYQWAQGGSSRPLFERLMAITAYRDLYTWHMRNLLDTYYYSSEHQAYVTELQSFISAAALDDPYRPLDWDYDAADFLNALQEEAAWFIDQGVLTFADQRKSAALSQLEVVNPAPDIAYVEEDFGHFNDSVSLRILLDGPPASTVTVNYSVAGGAEAELELAPVDGQAAVRLPLTEGSLAYQVYAYGDGGVRSAYCDTRTIAVQAFENSSVLINEVMTANAGSYADEEGDFDDWIELYNGGPTGINLGDYALSDNGSASAKFQLPETVLAPGDHIVFWCDGELDEGEQHCNFKLSAEGESVFLFRHEGNGLTLMDAIEVPALPQDFSYGRAGDGNGEWILYEFDTPNAPNAPLSSSQAREKVYQLPFPNPAETELFLGEETRYALYDLQGRLISKGYSKRLSVSSLASGPYLLHMHGRSHLVMVR